MGHQRLGTLPATRPWKEVIALITGGASAATVAAAVAEVAEKSLARAADDRTLRHGFWLLTQIPLAARKPDFGAALQHLGLEVSGTPSLIEIGAAVLAALDRTIATDRRANDLSEMAAKAAAESLVAVGGKRGEGLFGLTYAADEARAAFHALAAPGQFAVLARDFIGRLTEHCLSYFLSRTLPNHVGETGRFQSIRDHHLFEQAVLIHCRETSLIVETFAAEWFSKTNFEGGITREKAGGFIHHAFEKVRAELQVRAQEPAHA